MLRINKDSIVTVVGNVLEVGKTPAAKRAIEGITLEYPLKKGYTIISDHHIKNNIVNRFFEQVEKIDPATGKYKTLATLQSTCNTTIINEDGTIEKINGIGWTLANKVFKARTLLKSSSYKLKQSLFKLNGAAWNLYCSIQKSPLDKNPFLILKKDIRSKFDNNKFENLVELSLYEGVMYGLADHVPTTFTSKKPSNGQVELIDDKNMQEWFNALLVLPLSSIPEYAAEVISFKICKFGEFLTEYQAAKAEMVDVKKQEAELMKALSMAETAFNRFTRDINIEVTDINEQLQKLVDNIQPRFISSDTVTISKADSIPDAPSIMVPIYKPRKKKVLRTHFSPTDVVAGMELYHLETSSGTSCIKVMDSPALFQALKEYSIKNEETLLKNQEAFDLKIALDNALASI